MNCKLNDDQPPTIFCLLDLHPEMHNLILPHWYNFTIPDPLHNYLAGIFIGLIGVLGVAENLLVITIFFTGKSLRKPSNLFVINLAISDCGFSLINGFPLKSIAAFRQHWPWGQSACTLYGFCSGLFGFGSLSTMAVMSLERYCTIVRGGGRELCSTYGYAIRIILTIWIWSFLWSALPLFGIGRYVLEGYQTSCTFDYLSNDLQNWIFNAGLFVCGFLFPVMMIVFCYTKILLFIRNTKDELMKVTRGKSKKGQPRYTSDKRRADLEATKSVAILILLFLMAWTPYATVSALSIVGHREHLTPIITELPCMFAKTAAVYDPIVYAIKFPKFRKELSIRYRIFRFCAPKTRMRQNPTVVEKIRFERSPSSCYSADAEEGDCYKMSVRGVNPPSLSGISGCLPVSTDSEQ
ncbi:unnamed protein product [Calicophoron daubneyi]|uniref:G-protein coupled receptors family 1 profile domain-containing protein n=1 Tax=Calicophoron daubneyi TaxID=300641 RepID=A0AAV2TK22_CALDB